MVRFFCCSIGWAFLTMSVLAPATAAFGAPRLFLDSRPTNLDPANPIARLYFRELPRQALLVAAIQEFAATCIDPTLDPSARPVDGDIRIGLDYTAARDRFVLTVTLYDSANQPLDVATIQPRANPRNIAYLDEMVAQFDDLMQTKWKPLLARQLSTEPVAPKWDPALPAPEGIEPLLGQMDITSSFLAARLAHAAIAESGESPARLAALIRAYTNLGESTRDLISGASVGFFARALMYGQRLIRLAPNDPLTWWSRSYVAAIYGAPVVAAADLKRAQALNPPTEPGWAQLLGRFVAYDTLGLYARSRQADGALAGYLAWMTIEHAPLSTLPANFASDALQLTPGALRAVHGIISNTTSTVQHGYVFQSTQVLSHQLGAMNLQRLAPEALRQAAFQLRGQESDITSLRQFRTTLAAMPPEPGQPLHWPILATAIADAQFINAVRQLDHLQHGDNDDVRANRDRWVELLADHRYVDFIRSFGVGNAQPPAAVVERVRTLDFKDDPSAAHILWNHLRFLRIDKDPRRDIFWTTRWRQQSGNSAYDLGLSLWLFRHTEVGAEFAAQQTNYLRNEARVLDSMAPDHPLAVAILLMTDWPAMQDRAAELERRMGDNPIVAYGLGRGYLEAGRPNDTIRVLTPMVQEVPDYELFHRLADAYWARQDLRGWVNAWETYLRSPEDLFKSHAGVCEMMATRLVQHGEPQLALRYSQIAAATGSRVGLQTHATILLALRRYDEADQVCREVALRFDHPLFYYRFCRTTGRGNLEAAKAALLPQVQQFERSNDPNVVRVAGVYFQVEDQPEKARQMWQRLTGMPKNHTNAMTLALIALEDKQPDQAITLLQEASKLLAATDDDRAYAAGVAELLRCCSDPTAVPDRDGAVANLITSRSTPGPRGNVCYFLGRLCELRNHNDDAKWWYRAAMDCPDLNFTTRPLAALGLKRLGDDYYP